jgi:predicted CXXCH cytochrome family protein
VADVSVHAPFSEGMCDSCHDGGSDQLMEDGGAALCLACHSDVEEALASVTVPHAAMEMAACVACHSPHAAAQASLVKAPAGGPCLDCHDDAGASDDEVLHGAIAWFGCQACHEPHGGERANLLRDDASQLCLGCHSPAVADAVRIGGEVELLGRFTVPAARAAEIRTIQLSRDGLHNHPVTGHRVLGVPTPSELAHGDSNFSGELTCLSCHNPHKGRSRQLFANGLAGTSEVCEQCHVK